jgi:hypothetical protein
MWDPRRFTALWASKVYYRMALESWPFSSESTLHLVESSNRYKDFSGRTPPPSTNTVATTFPDLHSALLICCREPGLQTACSEDERHHTLSLSLSLFWCGLFSWIRSPRLKVNPHCSSVGKVVQQPRRITRLSLHWSVPGEYVTRLSVYTKYLLVAV